MKNQHVIVNSAGKYYNGNAYPMKQEELNWTSNPDDAFRYSEFTANKKIQTFPAMFGGCSVKKI